LARKARRILRIELAVLLTTDHKQIERSVAQILFRYNKGNGYGGAVWYNKGNGYVGAVCLGGFNVVFWIVNNR
jgi:hypothetical protein